ncbi:MAG: FAD-dependent oxidoreductase [Fusicatenibacter sp.]|nr:FAD-dependent oxidoreductase [Lachnospiraceae bacterium]MDY2939249.1 FAD-dependent oxidoreductase [Fusicatenibacter sp.]
MNRYYDIVIIGAGPAGLAAALAAKKEGAERVIILERNHEPGGILNQCIHNGFGLHTFSEELTGPEYADRFVSEVKKEKIPILLDTTVLSVSQKRVITAMNSSEGIFELEAGAAVLCMGCRERPRGSLNLPGFRPAGIFSAGTAQRLVNLEGCMPGREVVILGSGDIGLIMARRMTLEGAKVKAVAELMPYSGGLKRNIVQCLDDYGIPLKLSHTVVDIGGKERVESVTLARVDEHQKPIPGTEEKIACDTLLLSVGLIPENELSREAGIEINPVTKGPIVNEQLQTSIAGIFACGNVLHVHDLVDYVSEEAQTAGRNAARFVKRQEQRVEEKPAVALVAGRGVRYTVPSMIHPENMEENQKIRFRVDAVYRNVYLNVYRNNERIRHRKCRILTPGEMEEISLKKEELSEEFNPEKISIAVEEE